MLGEYKTIRYIKCCNLLNIKLLNDHSNANQTTHILNGYISLGKIKRKWYTIKIK